MWLIDSALVPVYPKLRLPFRSLTLAELHSDLMEHVVGETDAPRLSVRVVYKRGGAYLSDLHVRGGDARVFVK